MMTKEEWLQDFYRQSLKFKFARTELGLVLLNHPESCDDGGEVLYMLAIEHIEQREQVVLMPWPLYHLCPLILLIEVSRQENTSRMCSICVLGTVCVDASVNSFGIWRIQTATVHVPQSRSSGFPAIP